MNLKKIVLALYVLLIVCMGVATMIEKTHGTEVAHRSIYGAWWFVALWAVLAVASLVFLLQKRVQKRLPVFLLHVSLVVMLTGALVTHLTAESGTMHLRMGSEERNFMDADHWVQTLPFGMTLIDFLVLNYPGTDAVMDYRCQIRVSQGEESEPMEVSMNHIGRYDGYRFYQSAYDSDGQGTQLLVLYDPYGIALTYMGYVMLLVSMLWTLASRHTRIRRLYRTATRPLVLLALCWFASATVGAKTASTAPSLSPVSPEIAHEFGSVVVHYHGRLCPINTASHELVTKLCGKPSWRGYSADEIFMGWMVYYTEWECQPIIRVKSAEVQQLLGIRDKWASVRDFYAADNSYKLRGKANDASLPESTRKAIREADEKIQLLNMFYHSEMLHIFPLQDQSEENVYALQKGKWRGTWHAPGSTELPLGVATTEFQFINHAMDHLVQSVLVNDVDGAKQMIAKIKLYQREKAGDVLPSSVRVRAELLYNRLQSARWVVFLCLTLSLVCCLLLLANRLGRGWQRLHLAYILCQTIFLSLLFVLRWFVSGHIPMSNGFETMLFMAWVTLVMTLLVMRRLPILKAFGPVVSSFCMLVSMLAVGSPQVTPLMPVLQSPLLSIHVALVMIAYALLALITLLSLQSLWLVKKGRGEELIRQTALSQLMLYPAVFLLAMGIFVGAVWANVSWGTYWSWDPKETWALITLMIYALPLHRSFLPSSCPLHSTSSSCFSPVRYHVYVLLSFLTVLMTYFGVNYFLSGMHSYA